MTDFQPLMGELMDFYNAPLVCSAGSILPAGLDLWVLCTEDKHVL